MEYKCPGITADIIVEKDGMVLLIRRGNDPFKGMYAIPGGFLEYGKERLEETAKRELQEETSLIVKLNDLELIGVYSNPQRDPRGHVVSHVYVARNYNGIVKAGDDADRYQWFNLDSLPQLAFDHNIILEDFTKWKRKNIIV